MAERPPENGASRLSHKSLTGPPKKEGERHSTGERDHTLNAGFWRRRSIRQLKEIATSSMTLHGHRIWPGHVNHRNRF
jgi:hypothetical protein